MEKISNSHKIENTLKQKWKDNYKDNKIRHTKKEMWWKYLTLNYYFNTGQG